MGCGSRDNWWCDLCEHSAGLWPSRSVGASVADAAAARRRGRRHERDRARSCSAKMAVLHGRSNPHVLDGRLVQVGHRGDGLGRVEQHHVHGLALRTAHGTDGGQLCQLCMSWDGVPHMPTRRLVMGMGLGHQQAAIPSVVSEHRVSTAPLRGRRYYRPAAELRL